jgi:transposase
MNGYSEDLRWRIVSAVGHSMPKVQAARTFDVSLSSVKRYVNKANRGEALAPKKSPGSAPKLDEKDIKLLEEDLNERPYATLQERRDYIHVLTGLSVSRSTICRAIARIGQSRKKGDGSQRSATSSKEPSGE